MSRTSFSTKVFVAALSVFACAAIVPTAAFATPCKEIIDGGSYRNTAGFTRGPATAGCYVGQAIGGLLGLPVALVYTPIQAACKDGDAACKDSNSPIEDGGAFLGNSLSHLIGFPFFFIESAVTGWDDKEAK